MLQISEAILQAGAAQFTLDTAQLHLLERGGAPDGVVYEGTQGEQTVFLKFMPVEPDQLHITREKVEFVNYLRAGGVRVLAYMPSASGQLVECVEEEGQSWAVTTTLKAPGRHLNYRDPEDFKPTFFQRWGELIGQMHALAAQYTGGKAINSWVEEHALFSTWCADEAVGEKWRQIGDHLRTLPTPPDAFGLIHNDPHVDNMLVDDGQLTMLDFDVCDHHWFMTDIGIALFHPFWEQRHAAPRVRLAVAEMMATNFMEGYQRAYTLPGGWLGRLHTFLKYRQILFFIALGHEGVMNDWAKYTVRDLREAIVNDIPVTEFTF